MQSVYQHIHEIIGKGEKEPIAEICEVKHYKPGFIFGPHSHSNIEINYVRNGECFMRFENEIFTFRKNDVMVIYPNVSHYFEVGRHPASLVQLEFQLDIFPELKLDFPNYEELIFLHNLFTHEQKYFKIVNQP
jgi:mannose-6-phosphate isomerase-like protein (cupin superfamily)